MAGCSNDSPAQVARLERAPQRRELSEARIAARLDARVQSAHALLGHCARREDSLEQHVVIVDIADQALQVAGRELRLGGDRRNAEADQLEHVAKTFGSDAHVMEGLGALRLE